MNAKDLKEAQQIVDAIAWLDKALSMTLPDSPSQHSGLQLRGEKIAGYNDRYSTTDYTISPAARAAAFKVMREEWLARRADRVRRANQLGLVL